MEHQYKRGRKQSWRGELWRMEGLASKAKPAHVVFPVGTTTEPLTCAPGAFQAYSLQMILWGASLLTSPILSLNCYKLSPYNWRRLWEGLYPGIGDSWRRFPWHFYQPVMVF